MTLLGRGDLAPSRNRRRRSTGLVVGVLAVLLLVGIAGGGYYLLTADAGGGPGPSCPPASASARPAPPLTPSRVHLRVLNGTGRNGLAKTTGSLLRARGFAVDDVGNTPKPVAGLPLIRFGTSGRPAADLLALQLPRVTLVSDPRLKGTVDLVLGSAYSRLRTPAELAAATKARAAQSSPSAGASGGCR